MADRNGILLAGDVDKTFDNAWAGHGSAKKIFILINGIGLDAWYNEVLRKIIYDILNVKLGCAAELCTLLQVIDFISLTDICAHTDDIIAECLLEPRDDGCRIQTAGIGEDDFLDLRHGILPPTNNKN